MVLLMVWSIWVSSIALTPVHCHRYPSRLKMREIKAEADAQTRKVPSTTLSGPLHPASSWCATDVRKYLLHDQTCRNVSLLDTTDTPARVQLYDTKNKPVHSFGSGHRNFLRYQPQGKLLLSAGFGNLAGGVDVWDMSTRNKVAEFK